MRRSAEGCKIRVFDIIDIDSRWGTGMPGSERVEGWLGLLRAVVETRSKGSERA